MLAVNTVLNKIQMHSYVMGVKNGYALNVEKCPAWNMNFSQKCLSLETCSGTAWFVSTLVLQQTHLLAKISNLITFKVSSALAITEIVKGAVEELKQDITARINEVKEFFDNLEKTKWLKDAPFQKLKNILELQCTRKQIN